MARLLVIATLTVAILTIHFALISALPVAENQAAGNPEPDEGKIDLDPMSMDLSMDIPDPRARTMTRAGSEGGILGAFDLPAVVVGVLKGIVDTVKAIIGSLLKVVLGLVF